MRHVRWAVKLAAVVAAMGVVTPAVHGVPHITDLLLSHGFEDDTDLELINGGDPGVGAVERSTMHVAEGDFSLHMRYNGTGGGGGDFFARWTGYQGSFDAGAPHDGYITTFQLYPIWGSQYWRGSTSVDGPNHIGNVIYAVGPSGYEQSDIVVGLMGFRE